MKHPKRSTHIKSQQVISPIVLTENSYGLLDRQNYCELKRDSEEILKRFTRTLNSTSFDANKTYGNMINANAWKKMHLVDYLLAWTGKTTHSENTNYVVFPCTNFEFTSMKQKTWNKKDLLTKNASYNSFPAGIYLLKVNNRNTRTRCVICSKLTIKTPERRH